MASRTRRVIAGAAVAVGLMAGLTGTAGATAVGNEGCTPGYWKNHTSNWEEYLPNERLADRDDPNDAALNLSGAFADTTFIQALNFNGGSGVDGATRILLRATAAAFLNAAHEGLGYPLRRFGDPGNIQAEVNAALASNDRQTMLDLAARLDQANHLGCPLN